MPRVVEADVCVVGAGITAAMLAEKLAEERDVRIAVVEAGGRPPPLEERGGHRARYLAYGENPWPDDHIRGQVPTGRPHGFSPSMVVGGLAMHWGAVTPRFSPEDFRVRSVYGVGDDWPIGYDDLDPAYQEAEERMGVAGEAGPTELDPRSAPYPMPPLPLTRNLLRLREWGESAGIPFWPMPSAKNSEPYRGRTACCRSETCWPVCPVGAKYSPDFTFAALEESGRATLHTGTLVRKLVPEKGSDRVERAEAVDRNRPDEPVHFRARAFVLAAGYVWSPHLLLLSATSRHPDGLANRSGLVGRYLAGHRGVNAWVDLPIRIYPGMNRQHSLVSKAFMSRSFARAFRAGAGAGGPGPAGNGEYLRHDFRIWESSTGREPRLRNGDGELLLGDDLLEEWRSRALDGGTARVRAYYDVLPARESAVTLDPSARNPWGDPLPRVRFRDSEVSAAGRAHAEESIAALFDRVARAGDGELLSVRPGDAQEHPGGGCRMGVDPERSVVNPWGRTHDHENLWVVGAPTMVTAGCTNGTLTMAALGIRAAGALGREFPARGPEGEQG